MREIEQSKAPIQKEINFLPKEHIYAEIKLQCLTSHKGPKSIKTHLPLGHKHNAMQQILWDKC